jgi:hypothetical protein
VHTSDRIVGSHSCTEAGLAELSLMLSAQHSALTHKICQPLEDYENAHAALMSPRLR